jgi:hypothetical protein
MAVKMKVFKFFQAFSFRNKQELSRRSELEKIYRKKLAKAFEEYLCELLPEEEFINICKKYNNNIKKISSLLKVKESYCRYRMFQLGLDCGI